MKIDPGKFKKSEKPERLEVYLLAADNPVGRKQLRPIFRRKRSKEILTREQVTAIKRGRRLLRREMKAQGLKRRIDFEVTATNLGLYFDRNRLFWPFFLWLIRDNTVAKILATTAVLTTVLTVTEPIIEYITQYVTQFVTQFVTQYVTEYVDQYIKEYVDRDRFTIDLSDGLTDRGFLLAETPADFDPDAEGVVKASTNLACPPVAGIPCISISSIPDDVHTRKDGAHHDTYFAYTFYAKYIVDTEAADAQGPVNYDWDLKLTLEQSNENDADISKAVWAMVFEEDVTNGEKPTMTFYAEPRDDGEKEVLPDLSVTDMAYVELPVQQFARNEAEQFQHITTSARGLDYYRLMPYDFPSDRIAATGRRENVHPNDIHKYTVVLWLEGDDPECTDELMGAAIGMNFVIRLEDEEIPEDTSPTDATAPSELT